MTETALQIDNLSVYYGDEAALSNVCLKVAHGEILGIIGPNGGGKSTLLKAILGLIQPTTGSVRIYGQEPGKNRAYPCAGNTPKRTKRSPLRNWNASASAIWRIGRFPNSRVENSNGC